MKKFNWRKFATILLIYLICFGFINYFIQGKPAIYFTKKMILFLTLGGVFIAFVLSYFTKPKH